MSSWSGQVFRVKTRCPTPYSGRPRIEAGKVNATPHNPVPYERHQGSDGDRSLARILRHLHISVVIYPVHGRGSIGLGMKAPGKKEDYLWSKF